MMASGRILLAEILERGETPLVVLYDTSQDDDVNINAACMKALQDKTLASPLQVTGVISHFAVTDGSFTTTMSVIASFHISNISCVIAFNTESHIKINTNL